MQQRATQDQIAYFGQTPSQLLTVPHLKKLPLADVLRLQVTLGFIATEILYFRGPTFVYTHLRYIIGIILLYSLRS